MWLLRLLGIDRLKSEIENISKTVTLLEGRIALCEKRAAGFDFEIAELKKEPDALKRRMRWMTRLERALEGAEMGGMR